MNTMRATPHRVEAHPARRPCSPRSLIAGLVLESARLERFIALMPTDPASDLAIGVIAAVASAA